MKELSKQTTTEVSVVLNRSIFFFYEKSLRYVPVFLMLCHWYGVYSFHDNPREILIDVRENEECIAYLYFMVYIFPVVFMLPASHFFKLCWIWRIVHVFVGQWDYAEQLSSRVMGYISRKKNLLYLLAANLYSFFCFQHHVANRNLCSVDNSYLHSVFV